MKRRTPRQLPMEYDAELYRALERSKAFFALNVKSNRPGKAASLIQSQEDYGVYLEGVNVALGLHKTLNYQLKTDTYEEAMQAGDNKVLRILAEAAEDVRRAYEQGISKRAQHVVSVIGAKLELETLLGGLPTEGKVKERARELYKIHFGGEAYPLSDYREWQDIIKEAGLSYLPKKCDK